MAGESSTPLLSGRDRRSSSSSSRQSKKSNRKGSPSRQQASESTPLLSRRDDEPQGSQYVDDSQEQTESEDNSIPEEKKKSHRRWPTIVALSALTVAALLILGLGFAGPAVVKEYSKEALVFEPTQVSIESFTPTGVQARFRGDFMLDASRVQRKPVRDLGRAGTWIAREVETEESEIQVYLPEYGNILLGTATLPRIKVNIRDGHVNHIDILSDVRPGDFVEIRRVANDWLGGQLGQLQVKGIATVGLKSGLFSLGSQTISEALVLQDQDLPDFPKVNVTKLDFYEMPLPGGEKAMASDISVSVLNKYPLKLTIPPLGFDVLVPNCSPGDPRILVADVATKAIEVKPEKPISFNAGGIIHQLSDSLTSTCPGTDTSPLDTLVDSYIQGMETVVYVRGATAPSSDTPTWVADLMKNVTASIPFSGRSFGHLIKNFTMTDVHVSLPDPTAKPDTPEAQPRISSLVKTVIDLPEEMNFPVNISRIRTSADVAYKSNNFGYIDLEEWHTANTSLIDGDSRNSSALLVEFDIKDVPLQITDTDTFTDVMQDLLFGAEPVRLQVVAKVDAETDTALGTLVLREIPAEGKFIVPSPLGGGGGFEQLQPRIDSLKISHTTKSSVSVEATMNFTNPTTYSAEIPLIDMHLLSNGTTVGHVTGRHLVVKPGNNTGVSIDVSWNPLDSSGPDGVVAGRDLLSAYVSGLDPIVTFKTHENTIPGYPELGQALSVLGFDVKVPKVQDPGDGGDENRFIKDATVHLWSSTAVFTLLSPLPETTLFITSIDATAFYNHTEPVGRIKYGLPFAAPPGTSQTPRLPVELNLGGVGYDALKKALGGTLEMDAEAKVGVRLDEYSDVLFYVGKGIGAKVRI
ncbi:hypothetical protein FQN54_009583 [Arachnomyces sp. PD_36]|nr:hypothetical protein FQN54_009583 [Arachnomyces sp. PD_36]